MMSVYLVTRSTSVGNTPITVCTYDRMTFPMTNLSIGFHDGKSFFNAGCYIIVVIMLIVKKLDKDYTILHIFLRLSHGPKDDQTTARLSAKHG